MDDHHLYHVLIAHPKDQAILLQNDRQLPVIRFDGCTDTHLIELCELVRRKLGCDFHLIRLRNECASPFMTSRNREMYWCTLLVFEIPENQHPTAQEGYFWMPKADTHQIRVEPPRAAVIQYLEKYKREGLETNTNRLFLFSRVGWYGDASLWIKEELEKHGNGVKSISQLRSGADSCVLRVRSVSGLQFYMKAVTPGGWYEEVKVTKALAEVMPEHFPQPMSYDLDKNWLLMRDYGKSLGFEAFSAEHNQELMERVLSRWAEIQKKSIPVTEQLVRLGVPMQDGRGLKQELLKVLEDPEWFEAQREGMDDEERRRYTDLHEYKDEYISYVDRLLEKLSKYKVPLALVHGDLNTVNVIENGESDFTFIDVYSARISFPFLDVLRYARDVWGGDVENLDFYLKFWTNYESLERIRELLFLVNDIDMVEGKVSQYLRYTMGEEGEKLRTRKELRFTVIYTFNKYRDHMRR